eukprot:12090649-Ditylum_brightwellii.AAC.1
MEGNKMMFTNLTAANLQLTQQVANLTHKMTDKDTKLNTLKQSIDKLAEQVQAFVIGQTRNTTPSPKTILTEMQEVVEGSQE